MSSANIPELDRLILRLAGDKKLSRNEISRRSGKSRTYVNKVLLAHGVIKPRAFERNRHTNREFVEVIQQFDISNPEELKDVLTNRSTEHKAINWMASLSRSEYLAACQQIATLRREKAKERDYANRCAD